MSNCPLLKRDRSTLYRSGADGPGTATAFAWSGGFTQEVELHLGYRRFCRLDLDEKVPHHSTFSENRLHRFRQSDVFRRIFERVVAACMTAGLIKGEGFAVDASVMEANASRYHGKAPEEIEWADPERQTCAVKEYLAAIEAEVEPNLDRKPPKVISPSDPQSAWTAKANKRVQFGYGLNYPFRPTANIAGVSKNSIARALSDRPAIESVDIK